MHNEILTKEQTKILPLIKKIMKNFNQTRSMSLGQAGFAPIVLILAVVAVLALSGGLYYFKKVPQQPQELKEVSFEFVPAISDNKELIIPATILIRTPLNVARVELYTSEIMQEQNTVKVIIGSDNAPVINSNDKTFKFLLSEKNICQGIGGRANQFMVKIFWSNGIFGWKVIDVAGCKMENSQNGQDMGNKGCIQVIAPAKNPATRECKEFPTPCDVPQGWEKVDSCVILINETTDWKIYRNEKYGFEFKYPKDWVVNMYDPYPFEFYAEFDPNEPKIEGISFNRAVELAVMDMPVGVTLKSFAENTILEVHEGFRERGITMEDVLLDSIPAIKIHSEYKAERLSFFYKNKAYILSDKENRENITEESPEFSQILSTFKFIK